MASQMRDKIVKEGAIRYRQSTIGLQKWRLRHLVFKVTHAGRLQLIVHKESPATAANEIKEIAIDEFGGLEQNLKLDSEKYVFAIITTHITECFSTESPKELTGWVQLLQEYLGKELVISINIPVKQQLLKAGKGALRIRNTGFTITTCDNPPRCQGTWHIIHIRKYGGSDLFRFQTGSKCPTGEFLYSIETKDNAGLKKLFNDLSNHRPIFSDDRLGRRMTLERSFNRAALNPVSRTGNNRLSLQPADRNHRHIYENRNHVHESAELCNSPRRASFDDGAFDSSQTDNARQSRLLNGEDDKVYQNVQPSSSLQQNRASPTKKTHLSSLSVPVPEGYYTVTPPPLVRRHNSSNGSSSSSPEDSTLRGEMSLMETSLSRVSWTDHDSELTMDIVGEGSVGNKLSRQRSKALSPPSEAVENDGMYQNVELAHLPLDEQVKRLVPSSEVAPSIPEEPWSPHNYTNIDFAQASAHGQGTSKLMSIKMSKRSRVTSQDVSPRPLTKVERKISMPVKFASRDNQLQSKPPKKLVVSTSSDDLLSPSHVQDSGTGLRNSLSDQELNVCSTDKSLNYYNYCAPSLPAHSSNQSNTLSLRNKLTLSSGCKLPMEMEYSDDNCTTKDSPSAFSPAYASIDDFKLNVLHEGNLERRSSSCDCLAKPEIDDMKVKDTMYDKLVPLSIVNDVMYDKLEPVKDCLKSSSSSPDPTDCSSIDSMDKPSRTTNYLRRVHMYEYIEGEIEERGSVSPDGMEHPSNWTVHHEKAKTVHPMFSKETNTLSRRKHLPLQNSVEKRLSEVKNNSAAKINPPRLSRESSLEIADCQGKRSSFPTQATSFADSVDMASSSESAAVGSRQGSSVSLSSKRSSALIQARRDHSNSPIHRVTHEAVEIRKPDAANGNSEFQSNTQDEEPPPIPEREGSPKNPARGRKQENNRAVSGSPPLPLRSQEPRFTVPLPHAEFDFVTPPPPPRPKMLFSPGPSYTAVTFGNGDSPAYTHIEPVKNSQRSSMKVSQTGSDVSYASVDFQMTAGLQRTSEQVADHQRQFFETK